MVVSVEIQGVNREIARLRGQMLLKGVQADKAFVQISFFMEGQVKDSIAGRSAEPPSFDTGRFFRSVVGTTPARFTAKIESNVEYAKFLEFGTSRFVGRKHFRNSVFRNRIKIINFIKEAIK